VGDADLAPIPNAKVEPKGFRIGGGAVLTDAAGEFEVSGGPRCSQSGATSNWGIDYLRVSREGWGVALVDPCAEAPWAEPIRLRPGASLAGRLEGVPKGCWINVVAAAPDLMWPPRSGLMRSDESWRAYTDEEGKFEISNLPAQVPLTVSAPAPPGRGSESIERRVVLVPGERRWLDLGLPPPEKKSEAVEESQPGTTAARWILVDVSASNRWLGPDLTWFEFVRAGRLKKHLVGGGRWHVHQHRACNHLEITPGRHVLVGRHADGSIGVAEVEVAETAALLEHRMELAPGGLVRIDGSALESEARISLSSAGLQFAVFELIPNVVRYEVVPSGRISLAASSGDRAMEAREIGVPAGAVVDVRL